MARNWFDLIDDRPDDGTFRVRRDIFSDPRVYEREVEQLFEGGWIYLAHETQLPRPHDYVTVFAGRRPLVVMRDGQGKLRAFHNACPHKGAMLCPLDRGNTALHVCPYHSWSFASDGRNRAIKAKAQGAYTPAFLADSHDMVPISRFGQYRGFLFGSLSPDVPSLEDHLGDARVFVDLVEDQSPGGLEFVPGQSTFTYEGNWKHQLENCSDGYHVTSVHPTYMKVAQDRAREDAKTDVSGVWDRTNSMLSDSGNEAQSGSFSLANGHVVGWAALEPTPGHPLYEQRDELIARVGPTRAKWMFYGRNVSIFPNLQLVDNFSTQIRVLRPLAAGRTEMATWCVGPRGENARSRSKRLRQYEDFFMPSGMATPDDLVVYQDCQMVDTAATDSWQSYARGIANRRHDVTPEAQELDITPTSSARGSGNMWDETLMQNYYRAWRDRIAGPAPVGPAALPELAA